MAHNAGASLQHDIEPQKLAEVWNFRSSPAFSDAERAALELAIAAGAQPNEVTDEMFEQAKRYWSEGQLVEIVSLVSFFGFYNRYNDTMATTLEDEAITVAEEHISQHGWKLGKHAK